MKDERDMAVAAPADAGSPFALRRRDLFAVGIAGFGMAATGLGLARDSAEGGELKNYDPIRTELVMNLVVTCSTPETMGPNKNSKDGVRDDFWPIIGGNFEGPSIRGDVMPGGADYPLVRPDGVVVIDAFYRLRTHDGTNILIHNKGLAYPGDGSGWGTYRLVPEFTAPQGPYDWLNKSIFLSTLVETPTHMAVAEGPNENDRLIQVHRVL